MDAWLGKTNAIGQIFVSFDALLSDPTPTTQMYNLFTHQLPALWSTGHVPMVAWQPKLPDGYQTDPHDMAKRINGNAYDSYLNTWAILMKQFLAGPDEVYGDLDDRRVFIRFAHEPNIFGRPYGPNDVGEGQTASEYVDMWHHVRERFQTQFNQPTVDRDRIQWVWSVTWLDVGVSAESVFPGTDSVDWVGVDAYDRADPGDYCDMLDRIRALAPGKPAGINEWGYETNTPPVPVPKNDSISTFFDWVHANDLKMVVAFNAPIDGDWRVFDLAPTAADKMRFAGRWPGIGGQGPYGVYPNYKTKAAEPWVVGSSPTNLRLITSSAFMGG